jgi:hypothetical protein
MGNETEYDYEEVETQVLTRWERIKQWLDILRHGFTLYKVIAAFLVVGGSAIMVGEVTDTKPIRDAAVTMGLLDEHVPVVLDDSALQKEVAHLTSLVEQMMVHEHARDGYTVDQLVILNDKIDALDKRIDNLPPPVVAAAVIKRHDHDPVLKKHSHDTVAPHEHTLAEHEHFDAGHTHAETVGPASEAAIDSAFIQHIKDDH